MGGAGLKVHFHKSRKQWVGGFVAGCVACFLSVLLAGQMVGGDVPITTEDSREGAREPVVESAEAATIVRVVDGDTFVISIGGEDRKVRLIGIDAPESVSSDEAKNCEEGRAAAAFARSLLPSGTTVWTTREVSDTDRYGRLLRHIWLRDPAGADPAEAMVDAVLVREGHAQATDWPPDTAYSALFHRLSDEAASSHKGMSTAWAR